MTPTPTSRVRLLTAAIAALVIAASSGCAGAPYRYMTAYQDTDPYHGEPLVEPQAEPLVQPGSVDLSQVGEALVELVGLCIQAAAKH